MPDLVGYFDLLDRSVPPHVHAAVQRFRYHRRMHARIVTAAAERQRTTPPAGPDDRRHPLADHPRKG